MKTIIHLTQEEEAKALPVLLRHAPGMILAERTYALGEDTVGLLQKAGVRFTQLSREIPPVQSAVTSVRVQIVKDLDGTR